MTVAYDRVYLEKARNTLGRMLDYAVNVYDFSLEEFYQLFLKTRIAWLFARGDCSIVAGHSGIELVYMVLEENNFPLPPSPHKDYIASPSKEFWTGWVLAYFQWQENIGFDEIEKLVPINKIIELYCPYHEMDVRQFVDKMNEMIASARK